MQSTTSARLRATPLVRLMGLAFAGTLAAAALPAQADELGDLKAQIQALTQRLGQLENQQKAASAAAAAPAAPAKAAPRVTALTTDQDGRPAKDDSAITLYSNGQSSLTIYGLIEATLSDVNHQDAAGHHATGYQTAYFSGNRLGFDVQHALGSAAPAALPDLKIIAKLENEFEMATGWEDTPGQLFNRDAWLGLYSKDLGKLTFGRQNTLTRDFTNTWGDPYGSAEVTTKEGGYSNVNNFKQFIYYSGSPSGTRMNSSVMWKKVFDEHLVVGAAYGFNSAGGGGSDNGGGSLPGDHVNGTSEAVSVAYNKINVGSVVLNVNGNYARGINGHLLHQTLAFGGNVVAGPFRFNAGLVHYTAEQGVSNSLGKRTDNSWTTSISYQPNAFEYDLGYQVMKGTNAGMKGGVILNAFADTSGATATADGSKRSLYGAVRYHFDKQADIYFAADRFNVTGNWVVRDAQKNGAKFGAGQAFNSELEFATGMRFKF
ncbi:porin [Burkholderiaceae bacterium UC74_6]